MPQSFDEWLRGETPSWKNARRARFAIVSRPRTFTKSFVELHIEKMHTNIVAVGSGSAEHVTTGFNLAYQWRVNWPGNF